MTNQFLKGAAGGGGASPLTTKGDVYTYDTGDARLAVGGDGQVLSADSAETTGLKWITLSASGLTWSVVAGTSQTIAADNGYIANNAGLVTFTLPATCTVGDVFKIVGKGAGMWSIAQNASQSIVLGNQETTTGVGGSLDATDDRDSVEIVCTETNVEFTVVSSIGNLTVV